MLFNTRDLHECSLIVETVWDLWYDAVDLYPSHSLEWQFCVFEICHQTVLFLSFFSQILFFQGPVPCRLVQWNGVQEYPDQSQDACRSHAWRCAPSTQQLDQREALLPLPVVFKQQPAQHNLKRAVETDSVCAPELVMVEKISMSVIC